MTDLTQAKQLARRILAIPSTVAAPVPGAHGLARFVLELADPPADPPAPAQPLTVEYWRLTQALGGALDHDSPEFWRVAEALEAEFPQFSWHNAMTDGGPPR